MQGIAHISKDAINIPLHAARYSRERASFLFGTTLWCSLTAGVERKSLALSRRTAPSAAVAAYAPFPLQIFGCRQRPAEGAVGRTASGRLLSVVLSEKGMACASERGQSGC